MAAKFTHGASISQTNSIKAAGGSHSGKITLQGMPGHIKTGQTTSSAKLTGGGGSGPKREGPIGKRGSSGAASMAKASKGAGTVVKSYRAASTGQAGKMESMKGRARTSWER